MSVVGIDIARRSDYAAAVHLVPVDAGRWRVARAEQIPHGATYDHLAGYAAHLANTDALVALDATGVGAPVLEAARKRAASPVWGLTIHGGRSPSAVGRWDLSVPKRGLIEHARRCLDSGVVTLPRSAPGAALLVSQLAALAPIRRRGRRPSIAAARGHDDVAFGLLLACWMACPPR